MYVWVDISAPCRGAVVVGLILETVAAVLGSVLVGYCDW